MEYYTGTAPNVILWFDPVTKYGTIAGSVTKCNTMFWIPIPVPTPIPAPNVIPLYTIAFMIPNVIIIISLILVTVPNAFADYLFINPLCAHVVFERSTDRE